MILNTIKTYTLYILIAITLTLGGLYLYEKDQRKKAEYELVIEVNNRKAAERGVQIWKDEAGRSHASSLEYIYTLKQFKKSADSVNQRLLNRLSLTDSKLRNVERLLEVSNSSNISLGKDIYIPTMPDTTLDLSDAWTTNIIKLSPTKITSDISSRDTLFGAFTSHKETVKPRKKFFLCRWFQKKHTVVEVELMNTNPNVEITDQRLIGIID